MKSAILVTTTLVAALLSGGNIHASDTIGDHNEVLRLRSEGKILPLEEILGRAKQIQSGHFIEAELERDDGSYVYELEIVDDDGRLHKLYMDAATGELVKRKQKKD